MVKTMKAACQRAVSVLAAAAMLLVQGISLPQTEVSAATTDIYVGYPQKSNNYSTVTQAMQACKSINPKSESERITVHIAPGTYREQILVTSPYVTFINDEPQKGDAVLTWYYGIGYNYYSVGSDGRYNAANAAAKSAKAEPKQRWGGTVQLIQGADFFRAENIVFENSFNRYVTQEELADGVEPSGSQSITFNRTTWGADVRSKAATERGAALTIDANNSEFLNCKFLGSQDTLYTGGNAGYFRKCRIEGNTDYIFGSGDYVFDACELHFFGYSSSAAGGYITAARQQEKGYLFYNCNITGNSQQAVSQGYLGRPWRDTAKVMFLNTTIQNGNLIKPEGWTSMSGVEPTQATFKEYGTKFADGTYLDLSPRKGIALSASDAATVTRESYLSGWTPAFFNKDSFGSNNAGNNNTGNNGNTNVAADGITLCGGWFETAFAEWDSSKIGSNVTVSYKDMSASSYTAVDPQLIRGTRVDIPGLKGNTTYDLKIAGSAGTAECTVTTMSYDRGGYAHWKQSAGVGGYNNDGTPKAGATILYVTDQNKDTVSFGGKTGLYDIMASSKPQNLIIRLIGSINVPKGARANDGSSNDGSHMLYLQNAANVTIEGIGYDANLVRWGFEIKRSNNIEVRNLYFNEYPDDAIGMNGAADNMTNHIWIHNNSFGSGKNEFAGNGTVDDDKAHGDGTTDMKWTEYVTVSYNHYVGTHKTSLVGGDVKHLQDWITYHHNWFDGTASRNPRARRAHVHVYNNYFKGNSDYGIGASYNSKIFSESNFFENSKSPLNTVAMGNDQFSGTIKSFGDKLVNCSGNSVYTKVNSRMDAANINNLVGGGEGYDNFDIDASKIYLNGYTAQSPDDAKATVMAYSGRMKRDAYNSGTVIPPTDTPDVPDVPENPDTPVIPDVPSSADYILNAGNVPTGAFSSDVKVNSVYTIKANAADAVTVADNSYTTADGSLTINKRLFLGGKGDTANRSIQISAPNAGTIKVYMMSSNATTPRTVNLLDSSGNPVVVTENVVGSALNAYTMEIPRGGEYYLASAGSGLYVFYVQYTPSSTPDTPITPEPEVLKGDLTGDGILNAFDLAMLKKDVDRNAPVTKGNDLNSDGAVNAADVVILTNFILGR